MVKTFLVPFFFSGITPTDFPFSPSPFPPHYTTTEQAPSRINRAAPPGGPTMERPVSAPGGVSARRNQILERPVLARRCRAHAPPGPVTVLFIIFTGTLALASLNDPSSLSSPNIVTPRPAGDAHGPHAKARPDPRRRLLRDLIRDETLRVRILVHRPRRQTPLAHESSPLPARSPPRPSSRRSSRQGRGGRRRRQRSDPR